MTQLISREKLEYIAKKVLHYPLHDEKYYTTLFTMLRKIIFLHLQ